MSFFGEIVEPTSRTIWEEWDDVIPDHENSCLQWENPIEINEEIDIFYLIDGKHLTRFINQESQQLEFTNKLNEVDLKLFKICSQSKYLCVVKDYDMVVSSEIVELLIPYIKSCKNVITIQSNPMSEYRSNQIQIHPCIVRGIYTSILSTTLKFQFPKLEQPNILSGVAAGVITLREQFNSMGVAIICYIENTEFYQIEELQKLLNVLDIGSVFQMSSSSVLNSNLYI